MDVKPNTGENTLDAQIDLFDVTSEQFDSSLLQKATPEYLQELLKDKKQLQSMPNSFKHVELVLEKGGFLYCVCFVAVAIVSGTQAHYTYS